MPPIYTTVPKIVSFVRKYLRKRFAVKVGSLSTTIGSSNKCYYKNRDSALLTNLVTQIIPQMSLKQMKTKFSLHVLHNHLFHPSTFRSRSALCYCYCGSGSKYFQCFLSLNIHGPLFTGILL